MPLSVTISIHTCSLPANADAATWSAKDVDCDALVAIVSKCLARVQAAAAADSQLDIALPESSAAPIGVAARHRLGSQLASILKVRSVQEQLLISRTSSSTNNLLLLMDRSQALGYAGDCGYNHFLYPSEKETRTMLTWLVGKLPRAASAVDSATLAGATQSMSLRASLSQSTASATSASASLLSTEQLQCVFANWKRSKTLHVLPNHRVAGLRGFQSLALETASVSLPWHEATAKTGTIVLLCDVLVATRILTFVLSFMTAADRFLFDTFPHTALRATSLLEALASSQRKRTQRMDLFEDDDDDDVAETPVAASGARAHKVSSSDAVRTLLLVATLDFIDRLTLRCCVRHRVAQLVRRQLSTARASWRPSTTHQSPSRDSQTKTTGTMTTRQMTTPTVRLAL